jgi:hypothetical protein
MRKGLCLGLSSVRCFCLLIPSTPLATQRGCAFGAIIACFVLSIGKVFALSPQIINPPSRSITLETIADWQRHQQISNGYIVSFSQKGDSPNDIVLTSLATGEERIVRPRVNGTTPSLITAAAIRAANEVAVSGIYTSITTGNRSSFVAVADFSGQTSAVIELGVFAVNQLCTTGDGTTWVLGQDVVKEGTFWRNSNDVAKIPPADDYDMLRGYASDGALIRSAIKRSSIQTDSQLYLNLSSSRFGTLVCGPSSVGVYLAGSPPVNFQAKWHELSLVNGTVSSWAVEDAPSGSQVSGLALPHSNTVISSFSSYGSQGSAVGIYTLALGNNGVAKWMPSVVRADSPASDVPRLKILGSNGTDLVYVNGLPSISSNSAVVLSTPTSPAPPLDIPILPSGPKIVTPQTGIAQTAAGNVQITVDNADYLLKGLARYSSSCYTPAVLTAVAALQSTVNTWRAQPWTAKSRPADERNIKTLIINQQNALNTALQAQTGGSCPLAGVVQPVDESVRSIPAVYDSFSLQGQLIRVSGLDSCRNACGTIFGASVAICSLFVITSPNRTGVAVAAACIIAAALYNIYCFDNCAPDTACYDAPNYNFVSGGDRRPKRKATMNLPLLVRT